MIEFFNQELHPNEENKLIEILNNTNSFSKLEEILKIMEEMEEKIKLIIDKEKI